MGTLANIALLLIVGGILGGGAAVGYISFTAQPTIQELCNARLTPTEGPIRLRAYVPEEDRDRWDAAALQAYLADRSERDYEVSLHPSAALEDFKAEAIRWGPRGAIVARFTEQALFEDVPTDSTTLDALAYSIYGSPCTFVSYQQTAAVSCPLRDGTQPLVQREYAFLLHEIGHLLAVPDHQEPGVMGKGAYKPCTDKDRFTRPQLEVIHDWGTVGPLPPPPANLTDEDGAIPLELR